MYKHKNKEEAAADFLEKRLGFFPFRVEKLLIDMWSTGRRWPC